MTLKQRSQALPTTFAKRRPGAPRDTRPPPMITAPLIAVQFVMRETLDPDQFRTAWPDFMAGYRHHFRAGGLRTANAFALRKLSDLGKRSNRRRR